MSKTLSILAAILAPLSTGSSVQEKLFFVEKFDSDVFQSGKWTKSAKGKYEDQPVAIKPSINSPPEFLADNGIELTKEMRFYGFGSKFPTPLIVKDQDLVVQYEFKADSFQCGGAYVKFPRSQTLNNFADLDNDTPYTIMFGPDKCGSTNKVHFILQHQNPLTSKWEEKHFADAPLAKTDANTHLYTLHIRKDNTFAIYIDKELEKEGDLLTSMQPPVNPPKTIDDPTDKKPRDWVDEAKIVDPTASKPDDWDESQPAMIVDPDAKKPAGWLDEVEPSIDDPEAEKPVDWDDEEDGEWEAPKISNPLCTVGCGPWTAPRIRNPLYKGKWTPPYIDNPLYKGEWTPRQIPNPDYYEDLRPADVAPIGGIAIEVWTTTSGYHFDNFAISNDLNDIFRFADETFVVKAKAEAEQNKKELVEQRKQAREEKLAEGGFANTLQVYIAEFFEYVSEQPPAAIVIAVILLFTTIFFFVPNSSKNRSETKQEESHEEKQSESEEKEEKEEKKSEVPVSVDVKADAGSEEEESSSSSKKKRTRKTD